jgi:phospho-N-acetylmuramoyl-pentapeptide-transferase
MLFHLFNTLRERLPGANVFRYVSTRIGLATLTSLLITFIVAPWFIRRARERQLGELIRDDGPASHASKKGTPTMGGALIIMALCAGTILWCDLRSTLVWLALLVTVGYGAIGFVDDYLKLSKKNKKGPAGQDQAARAVRDRSGRDDLALPRRRAAARVAPAPGPAARQLPPHVGDDDRLDDAAARGVHRLRGVRADGGIERRQPDRRAGRAGRPGPVIICSFTFMFLAYAAGTTLRNFNIAEYLGMAHVPGAGELAVFCGAMGGAGIGFLWFNTHPAQVFMGDVGALALGGAIGFVGLATKTELALPIIGGVFVAEAVSDIIQVAYYKRPRSASS